MLFSYDHLTLRYEPFPIGVARPLISDDRYRELLGTYPPHHLFVYFPKVGNKFTLSERSNSAAFHNWLLANPVWGDLHRWIKSDGFIYGIMQALRERHVDLGHSAPVPRARRLAKHLRNLTRGRLGERAPWLTARLEFSMLPATGGYVLPHTDAPGKIVTMVVSMVDDDQWNPAFGGGTDVNRPREPRLLYNEQNAKAGFEDMEVVHTYPFQRNQAVIFVKTFNSWHSVRPMSGNDPTAMRRTLTINIEVHH